MHITSYPYISPFIYDCKICPTKCDGITVPQFDFEKDVQFSEWIENNIIDLLNEKYPSLKAVKTTTAGYPDIEILRDGNLVALIEIKGQARTFMTATKNLEGSGLYPSEIIALNLSDLERYFGIYDEINIPIYIFWCLMNRPCITGADFKSKKGYHQHINILRGIRKNDRKNNRRFRRKSGDGDIKDGEHKGVVVNYHFSLKELSPGFPDLNQLKL